MTSPASPRQSLRWWPCFIGGLLLPFFAFILRSWVPPHVATAAAFVVLWVGVGLFFLRFPPSSSWRMPRWLLGGAAGALVFGALTYLFPWL